MTSYEMSAMLGQRLAHLRQERGLQQADLARLVGLGQSMICRFERGNRVPDAVQLGRILFELNGVGYLSNAAMLAVLETVMRREPGS